MKTKHDGGSHRAPHRHKPVRAAMDRPLLLIVLFLLVFGAFMVFSASAPYAMKTQNSGLYYLLRDLPFRVLGVGLLFLASSIDYRIYRRFARPLFIIALISCALVFVPGLSMPINNAHRWIHLGPVTYMPSDGLKLASIVMMSAQLSRQSKQEMGALRSFIITLFLIAITVGPVMIQPNFSAVVVLSVTLMFLYFIGGMPWQFMLPLLLLSGAGAVVAFWPRPGNYRLERLMVMLNPMADPAGSGWQLIQSLYAVASGGLFGVGFGRGVQKYDYLADEPHNDFIFSVIAEELGFFGAAVVILLFVFLAWRGLKIARQASTRFGRLLAYGMTFLIVFQAMVNIGVSIGAVPTTGITLPFISYGGSSIAIMTAAAGILLSISRDRGDRRAS